MFTRMKVTKVDEAALAKSSLKTARECADIERGTHAVESSELQVPKPPGQTLLRPPASDNHFSLQAISPKAILESMPCVSPRDGHTPSTTRTRELAAPQLPKDLEDRQTSACGIHLRLDEICSQLTLLAQKFEQSQSAHAPADSSTQGYSLLAGKLEEHGHNLSLVTENIAKLDGQMSTLRAQLFLGSKDNINLSSDGLAQSYSLLSEPEPSVECRESLTKTRKVRFVDLGAAQLEPESNLSRADTITDLCRQRLTSGIGSLPEFGPLHRWNKVLTVFSTLVVVLNAVFIGWSVNDTMQALLNDEKPSAWIDPIESAFAITLFLDLVLRLLTWGKAFFVDPSERWWNLFDSVLVAIAILEPLFLGATADLKASRKFPAIRIFRALRVLRVVRQLGTLRLMFAMMTHAFVSVMWALVFILMFTYMAAVMFVQVTANRIDEVRSVHPSGWMQHVKSEMSEDWVKQVTHHYGDIRSASVTLLASISGGNEWVDVAEPLNQIKTTYMVCYLMFVMFCVFGLMNILTGIFVANTKEVSKIDRDLVIRSQLKDRKSFANQLKSVLRSVDKDDDGIITKRELIDHLATAESMAYLKTLDVTVSDAQGVFKLLDVKGTGEVDIDEFVLSLMRFQGGARAVDVATLLYEGKRNEARWNAYMDYIEEQFDVLKKRLRIDSGKLGLGSVETHVSQAPVVSVFSCPEGTTDDVV